MDGDAVETAEGCVVWRIVDWNRRFENSRTRAFDHLAWVPIPNKHDGDGYTELIEHEHGASHYGAWCVLIQVASKCRPRGTLIRETGHPHDADSLSRLTRIGAHIFREAIPRFIEIGWLENVNDSALTGRYHEKAVERNGTERNRNEMKYRPAGLAGEVLESFDSDNWQEARRLTSAAANKLWPKRCWDRVPMKPEDRSLLLRAAYLAVTRLSSDWWQTALDETASVKDGPRKPLGLFKVCLAKRPKAEGWNLNDALDLIQIPEKPKAIIEGKA
jgi:hypothetical protein